MGSPFKMKPKTPMMKALVGKQGNLPQHLQDKIKAAPESPAKMAHKSPAKSYGSKTKSPVMKKTNPYGDVVLDTKKETLARGEKGSYTKKKGGKNIITTETVQKGISASRRAKLKKALENKNYDEARSQSTMAKREGEGRLGTKVYVRQEGTGAKGSKGYMAKSTIAGTKGMRTLADGSKVMIEDTAQAFKKKGLAQPKPKARTFKGKASVIKPRKATAGKPSASTTELKKKETSPVKKNGKKYPPGINNNKPLTPAQKARIKKQQEQFAKNKKEGKPGTGLLNPGPRYLKPKTKDSSRRTPIKKKGVKALEAQRGTKNASPIKKYGSKKSPVMQQKLKKKDTKGKTKLPKIAGRDKEGNLKARRGPQSGSIGGVRVSIQTKGRSTKNTDLLEVGKKYYKKAKKYVKSKMN